MRMIIFLLNLWAFLGPISSLAQTQNSVPQLSGLPTPLLWQNETARWSTNNGGLTLTTDKKTDWFVYPGGGDYHPDSSPRLIFKTDDNFSFSTKVDVTANTTYDAGCIALYGTSSHWAKLCLEAQPGGGLSIISVVTRDSSDDVISYPVSGTSTYLKVAKSQRTLFFYASPDGRKWTIVRKFNLDISALSTGFSVQSPDGNGASAVFSDFHYQTGQIDLWKLQ